MLNVQCVQIIYARLVDVVSHVLCICHWHISQQNSTETIIPYSVVKFTNVNYVNEYLARVLICYSVCENT